MIRVTEYFWDHDLVFEQTSLHEEEYSLDNFFGNTYVMLMFMLEVSSLQEQ